MTVAAIITLLEQIEGSDRLFNPYRDHDPALESADAPEIRRATLTLYLQAMQVRRPRVMWLAEAMSRRGARRTGLPLTGDRMLLPLATRLKMVVPFRHPTAQHDDPGSVTARAIWEAMPDDVPLLWNAVMQVPHRSAPDYAIRTPSAPEIRANLAVLAALAAMFAPQKILCIGRVAERCAQPVGVSLTYVRHPAQGGLSAFREGCTTFLSS